MISETSLRNVTAKVERLNEFLDRPVMRCIRWMVNAYVVAIVVVGAFNIGQFSCMHDSTACAERLARIENQLVVWPW